MRELAAGERRIVLHLLRLSGRSDDIASARVRKMDDGGMGSLQFAPFDPDRGYGAEIAALATEDADGIAVVFSLIVDERDYLYELDVWRVDYAPLQQWPSENALEQATAV